MIKSKIILFAFIVFGNSLYSNSQCTNCGGNYPGTSQTTVSNSLVTVATDISAGDFSNYNVTVGETYTWTTCAKFWNWTCFKSTL